MEKIAAVSLASPSEEFHHAFDSALSYETKKLGRAHPLFIRGQKKKGSGPPLVDTNPADRRQVLGEFQSAGREETRQAIAAAHGAIQDWQELGWMQRVAFLRKAAALMTERRHRLAAVLALEVGKNRVEAAAEVAESIDLLLYHCRQMELHQGYSLALGGNGVEQTRSVLKPYGVWAVVAPFSFPLAATTGMAAGALLGGNTIVFKPSSEAPLAGFLLHELFHEAGLPVGVINFLTGPGALVGEELLTHPDVDGFAFSGSRDVGLEILRRFQQTRARPCLAEMGGNNPAIVMPSAHLEDAVDGILRSAFGLGGQRCSACSRIYLHQAIYRPFLELLVEKTRKLVVGDPLQRETFFGPLINEEAWKRYQQAVELGKKSGRLIQGGKRRAEFEHGYFVEPTLVERVALDSPLLHEEFFVPVLAIQVVNSLEEGITQANDSEYGLTAGCFSQEEHEQETFFDTIQAGVAYCNRRAGATNGAGPGAQSGGGWKNSGSSGKNALGPHYIPQFMREQSQTRLKPARA